jgi:hypothetical protein
MLAAFTATMPPTPDVTPLYFARYAAIFRRRRLPAATRRRRRAIDDDFTLTPPPPPYSMQRYADVSPAALFLIFSAIRHFRASRCGRSVFAVFHFMTRVRRRHAAARHVGQPDAAAMPRRGFCRRRCRCQAAARYCRRQRHAAIDAAAATQLLFSLFFFAARIAAATPIAFDFRRQFSPITPAD